MGCAAFSAAALLWLAATPPVLSEATSPKVAAPQGAVAYSPPFDEILRAAAGLKDEVAALRKSGRKADAAFAAKVKTLSDLDMQGHIKLRESGADGDLKCILKGISEDLPLKLAALQAAGERQARDAALAEMGYLLNDNIEVITAPPKPPV